MEIKHIMQIHIVAKHKSNNLKVSMCLFKKLNSLANPHPLTIVEIRAAAKRSKCQELFPRLLIETETDCAKLQQ